MFILEKEAMLKEKELRKLEKLLIRTLPKSFENESITSQGIRDGRLIRGIGVIFMYDGFYFEANGRAEGNSIEYRTRITVNLPESLQKEVFENLARGSPSIYAVLKN